MYTEKFAGGDVEIFFIDTTPFIMAMHATSWAKYDGGVLQQSWEAQLKEIEQRLASSTASWKLMVGHHPPRSNGHHGNNTELIDNLEPLLRRYGVRAYFSGHDHNLEHLRVVPDEEQTAPGGSGNSLHYFVSGGGSDCDRGFDSSVASLYQYPNPGFAVVAMKKKNLVVSFYTLESNHEPSYTYTLYQ